MCKFALPMQGMLVPAAISPYPRANPVLGRRALCRSALERQRQAVLGILTLVSGMAAVDAVGM
jgi:hypothetical protein